MLLILLLTSWWYFLLALLVVDSLTMFLNYHNQCCSEHNSSGDINEIEERTKDLINILTRFILFVFHSRPEASTAILSNKVLIMLNKEQTLIHIFPNT